MRSLIRGAARHLLICSIASLAMGGIALAAASGAFRGKTSQHRDVSFRISGRSIHNFKIIVLDKCPDGHLLKVTGLYPPMPIVNGRFGGAFIPTKRHAGEHAKLLATVGSHKVTGSLQDTSFSTREKRLCHGSIHFSATHG